ncbi:MAG: hypothetical protein IGS03_00945 [Candidatus Sericytochromatia bacterium]|nr:hypothetical protein [Candidatus Sericytochromatia bacterium]
MACQPGSPNLVGGQFWGQQRQQAVTSTAQQPDKIDLRFDPGLLGEQYQGLPKVPFTDGFRVQQQSHLFDQLDQLVLDKAEQLNIAGQGHCVYVPAAQPQNGNCNSTSTGLQCSGALDKTIQRAQCSEIVVYGGAVNINHDLSGTKLFIASSNNLTLNQSVEGILTTRGDLNVSLSN